MPPGSAIVNTASINSKSPSPNPAGLRHHQGGDRQLHGGPGTNGGQAGHPGKLCRSRPDLDAAYPLDDAAKQVKKLRREHAARPGRSAGGTRAGLVLLASDEASYMTGAMIPVTGGRPML